MIEVKKDDIITQFPVMFIQYHGKMHIEMFY